MTLSANQPLSDLHRFLFHFFHSCFFFLNSFMFFFVFEFYRMTWNVEGEKEIESKHNEIQGTVVTIKPMEIKTFSLKLN